MDENMGEKGNLPIMSFPSRETWAAWLDKHHTDLRWHLAGLCQEGRG